MLVNVTSTPEALVVSEVAVAAVVLESLTDEAAVDTEVLQLLLLVVSSPLSGTGEGELPGHSSEHH